jgi:hypothetical protein
MVSISRRSVIAAGLLGSLVGAAKPSSAAGTQAGRVVLKGYDPVAYFTEGRPEKGSPSFTASYDNATYWFKNAKHQSMFVSDPERYAPQYGGFCAIDLTRGNLTDPDPEAWAIKDGKLFVFGKKTGMSIFAEQSASIVEKSNERWPEMRQRVQ